MIDNIQKYENDKKKKLENDTMIFNSQIIDYILNQTSITDANLNQTLNNSFNINNSSKIKKNLNKNQNIISQHIIKNPLELFDKKYSNENKFEIFSNFEDLTNKKKVKVEKSHNKSVEFLIDAIDLAEKEVYNNPQTYRDKNNHETEFKQDSNELKKTQINSHRIISKDINFKKDDYNQNFFKENKYFLKENDKENKNFAIYSKFNQEANEGNLKNLENNNLFNSENNTKYSNVKDSKSKLEQNSLKNSSSKKKNNIENASTFNTGDQGNSHFTYKDKKYLSKNEIIINNLLNKNNLKNLHNFSNKQQNLKEKNIFNKINPENCSKEKIKKKPSILIDHNISNYSHLAHLEPNDGFLSKEVNFYQNKVKKVENYPENNSLSRNQIKFNCITSHNPSKEKNNINSEANNLKESSQKNFITNNRNQILKENKNSKKFLSSNIINQYTKKYSATHRESLVLIDKIENNQKNYIKNNKEINNINQNSIVNVYFNKENSKNKINPHNVNNYNNINNNISKANIFSKQENNKNPQQEGILSNKIYDNLNTENNNLSNKKYFTDNIILADRPEIMNLNKQIYNNPLKNNNESLINNSKKKIKVIVKNNINNPNNDYKISSYQSKDKQLNLFNTININTAREVKYIIISAI